MLKKLALKKILIVSLSFTVLLLIYFFPTTSNELKINTRVNYVDVTKTTMYLIDKFNYVSRIEVVNHYNKEVSIKDIINNLTIDSVSTSHIPSDFKKVIPKNTKLLDHSINNKILKLNFSKEFLNMEKESEEKVIEALIYTLTELKEVDGIMIFVEGDLLTNLPHSQKILPNILDRSYGINKVYDLISLKETTKVTTYYVSKLENFIYYTPVTTISNENQEKVEIIIENLKSNPTYQTNLISYLQNEAKLVDYQILENSVNLSFNNYILSLNDYEISEEVKYTIALSIKDTYNINETIFYVDDMLIDVFFV